MNAYKPRRPAQLKPDQIELIEGHDDVAQTSELAHTTAMVVVPLRDDATIDSAGRQRLLAIIREDGIDSLAETWVDSPAESLPGILWRGYLLREWIRRFPDEASERFLTAQRSDITTVVELSGVSNPQAVKTLWDGVFAGNFTGDFAHVLRESARFTDFIGRVQPEWIRDDAHPLATVVTRRDTALVRTAREFRAGGELLIRGMLN
ncbi:MAG: hypothetical protein PT944_04285 [Actinomycetaceae bacterium]|nr:hypothetical protein [Arcanobacterium sp.]MDD7687122.1 hypothetical protein [Actinomycetaceae bacterium]MDY5273213.1 hypothetical protein [Arcanobacterium sp.]